MPDDNLPLGPGDDQDKDKDKGLADHLEEGESQLPVRSTRALSVDLFDDDSEKDGDEIDLLWYWHIIVKRRRLVLSVVAAVVLIALIKTLLATSMYRATTVIQIDRNLQQIVQVQGMQQVQGGDDYDFYQTQYELLKSRALAERAADELGLAGSAELKQLHQPSWLQRLESLLSPGAGGADDAVVKPTPSASSAQDQLRSFTGVIQGGLTVDPIPDSALVRLHFDSPVPAFSARAANAVADAFIAQAIERRFGASSYAKKYLEDQLAQVKGKLEASESQLVDFAQQEGIVTGGNDQQSLVSQNLTQLNSELAAAQSQRIRAEARWREAQSARGAALPADMLANSIVRPLQQQRAELMGQYQQQLQIYKPDYPTMRQLKGQIDEIDKQVGNELANIRASVKAEYDAAQSQESLLTGKLAMLRDQTLDVDKRSIRYNILKREVDTNRQLYDSLLQNYKETGVAGNLSANNISIVDRAEVPGGRFSPNLNKNLAIGLFAGLVLGLLLAFLLEFLDDTLKTPQDIEQRLRLPVLGIIPKLIKQSPEEATHDLRSAFSESYRSVRTALQFSTEGGVPKVLLITSAGAGEGKTTSALALARNFAQMGKRVLLIDADLRNPSLHKTLGISSEVGLSSLLAGAPLLTGVIHESGEDRLEVIVAGPLPPNPAELLLGSKLVSLLSLAARIYDQVIIDGPPVLGLADAPILASLANGTLLVVHSGETRIANAQISLKRLQGARAHMIGTLLTQYDTQGAGYGYAYGGYHAYGGVPRLERE
ncbi:MAG: polysaccharide biosynthesis tyrosine autokinase [Luteimonas sp.]